MPSKVYLISRDVMALQLHKKKLFHEHNKKNAWTQSLMQIVGFIIVFFGMKGKDFQHK